MYNFLEKTKRSLSLRVSELESGSKSELTESESVTSGSDWVRLFHKLRDEQNFSQATNLWSLKKRNDEGDLVLLLIFRPRDRYHVEHIHLYSF